MSIGATGQRGFAWISSVGSAVALVASGVSLWETVLKQPQLKAYVGETISYTRDPYGSYEVFAVPISVSNAGAQNGALMALKLEVTNVASGEKDIFEGAYTADGLWFAGSDNVSNRTKRPKTPFAPLSVPGRSTWSGTILFYSGEPREKKIAEPKSRVTARLAFVTPAPDAWIDRVFHAQVPPIALTFDVPNYLPGALLSGDVARVRAWQGAAPGR